MAKLTQVLDDEANLAVPGEQAKAGRSQRTDAAPGELLSIITSTCERQGVTVIDASDKVDTLPSETARKG
jgi:hypothetical protein